MNNNNKEMGEISRNKILDYVMAYIQEHGYPPTRREIGEAVGLSSSATVQRQIRRMIADGQLETDEDGSSRALRVPGWKFARKEPETFMELYLQKERERIIQDACPGDFPFLEKMATVGMFEDKNCWEDCTKCWNMMVEKSKPAHESEIKKDKLVKRTKETKTMVYHGERWVPKTLCNYDNDGNVISASVCSGCYCMSCHGCPVQVAFDGMAELERLG